MSTPQHHRAFVVSAAWTLLLLFLGSVVHATQSSLACPDWPTCYGTMMPAMEGGIFWEHLHRLVAGGLILMWLLTLWLARREGAPASVLHLTWVGLALLLVQAVFGGVTVLLRLPPAVSTTHLGLAFLFLALSVALAVRTSPPLLRDAPAWAGRARALRRWGTAAAALVLAQSLLGGAVRHLQAGMACPDLPLCLGEVVPPLSNPLVAVHFLHRALAVLTVLAVLAATHVAGRKGAPEAVRAFSLGAAALVLIQAGLGVLSVASTLAVVPVSLHTLVAALLFAALVALAALGALPGAGRDSPLAGPAGADAGRAERATR